MKTGLIIWRDVVWYSIIIMLLVVGGYEQPAWALRASPINWKEMGERRFHYWINTASFTNTNEVKLLQANLARAMMDWESICLECDIHFIEVNTRQQALFIVEGVNVHRTFLANGFSPSDPEENWVIRIDKSYFSADSKFDKIGILRHEIGHVLGYRHEQVVSSPEQSIHCGWKTEKNLDMLISLTDYDPASVMHYPCGIVTESVFFNFSEQDKIGHRKLYTLDRFSN